MIFGQTDTLANKGTQESCDRNEVNVYCMIGIKEHFRKPVIVESFVLTFGLEKMIEL